MKVLLFTCLLFLSFLINGNHSLPSGKNVKYCDSCRKLVNFTKNVTLFYKDVEDNGDYLVSKFHNLCKENTKNNQMTCVYIVHSLSPLLSNLVTDGFCEKIEACINYEGKQFETIYSNDVECDFCLNTVNHLKEIISSNETENEIKFTLAKVCDYLNNFKNECMVMLDQNIGDIFEYLRNSISSKKLCDSIGYCSSNLTKIEQPKELAIEEVINIGPVISNKIQIKSKNNAKSSFECLICKKLLTYVYNYISDNKTEEAIRDALDGACSKAFSGQKREKCDQLVEKYLPQLIRVIQTTTEPELGCTVLGVCAECELCKKVFEIIYKELDNNRTEESIRQFLDSVCARFPKYTNKCTEFVNAYADEIVKLVVENVAPSVACKYLGFCLTKPLTRVALFKSNLKPLTLLQRSKPIEVKSDNPELCDICKKVFSVIYAAVTDKDNKDQIKQVLDKVCLIFPENEKDNCTNFINSNIENIFNIIASEVSPDEACAKLHVCNNANESNKMKWLEIEGNEAEESDLTKIKVNNDNDELDDNREPYNPTFSSKSNNETVCFVCQIAAHFIQEQLYNVDTQEKINKFIEQDLCMVITNYVPSVKVDQCKQFVKIYGPAIEELIAQKYFDPNKLCFNQVKVCKKMNNGDKEEDKVNQMQFDLIRPNKQRVCDICVKAVNGLDEILTNAPNEKDFNIIAEKVCISFPANEIDECKQLINTFGSYFIHIIGRFSDAYKVCHAVDLCMIPGRIQLLGKHKCSFGATYWCHSAAHAESCKKTDYCKSNIWKAIKIN